MNKKNKLKFATRAIHAGAYPEKITGARNTPIYQTTSFVFDSTEHARSLFKLQDFGFIYSRITNPTISVLEERIANLEKSRAAVACASGHAAEFEGNTFLMTLLSLTNVFSSKCSCVTL